MRARHQAGEGGFTLVEVMVAMLLLAIALTGLAQLAGSQMVASLRTRVRQVAISYINQELESLRSMTYTRLANDPSDSTVPTSKSVGGTTYNEVTGTSGCGGTNCLTYSRSVNLTNNQVSGNNFTFTETRWVGTAGGAYKTVFVTLTATSGPSFTYSSQTDVSGATTNNPTAVTALDVDLQQVDSSGNVVTDPTTGLAEVPPDGFNVTVMQGSTAIASGTTADGTFGVTSGLTPSTSYTCTVSNPGGASFSTWVAYSASDSSFTCSTGTAGTTSTYTSRWEQAGCTFTSSAPDGSLTVTVFNTSGNPVQGVQVNLTQKQGQANPPAGTTNTAGQVTWSAAINTGLFAVALSKGGLQPLNNDSSTCIWSGETSQLVLFGSTPPTKPAANANLTVPVENTYPGGTATLAIEAVDSTKTYKFEVQEDLNGCGSSCTATNFVLPVYTTYSYTVTVNCVGVGGAAPIGSTDGPTVTDGEPLYTWSTGTISGNTTLSPTGAVKCPQS
jgi:prepilin-type N-terminal cleavage/methylation domain-containing protein